MGHVWANYRLWVKNRFKSFAHVRSTDTVDPLLSLKLPEIFVMYLQTSLTLLCLSSSSIFILQRDWHPQSLNLRSFCFNWSRLPDGKALFFSFSRAFSSMVTHDFLLEKHCTFLFGTVFSTQKLMWSMMHTDTWCIHDAYDWNWIQDGGAYRRSGLELTQSILFFAL